MGDLDSRLRGVASGVSDDEHESVFSGTLSDADEQQAGANRAAMGSP